MWEHIYSHTVLLIFTNIILQASCKGSGSLTFLIDDTSSMGDDIDQVRTSVDRIKEIVLNESSSLIDNMVLVTLNDPGVHEIIATKNPDEFKKKLNDVDPHNEAKRPYLDCWEPAMKGLLLALEKSNNNSYVFVFTDAPAKDYIDSQSVIEMCQQKQTQIIFVLTGTLCGKFKYVPAAIDSYFDIAAACSGLAFLVQKKEVDKVFGPIEEMIKGNKAVIKTATTPAGVSTKIPFTVDGYTDYVIIYASGKNVSLKINQRSVSEKVIMLTDNAKAIKLTNIKPGNYVATVKGSTRTSVVIVGRTDFFFSHGFSELKPKSLNDTSPQPTSDDTKVYLSVSVTDDKHSVEIVSAQFLDMDGKPIQTILPLSKVSKDFYITDPFIAPSQRFKVAINGIAKSNGQTITRISKIPVTPPPQKMAPKVKGVTSMKVKKGETAQLECKVIIGFPAPKITWLFGDKSGSKFTPIPKASDSVLVIKNVTDTDDGKYKCEAVNMKGKDEHVQTLNVQDPPKIVSSITTVYKSTEGDAELKIPCATTGLPKPSIIWKLKNRVISQNAKYSFEDGTLIISDPKLSDIDSYTCEAKNEVGTDSATFKTDILQTPKLTGDAEKQVRIGLSASIECKVIKGKPKPTMTWQFKDDSSANFVTIAGTDKVLHIARAENKHSGRYKCLANNSAGSAEHITTLEVQDTPKIVSNDSTTYESTEGAALLKIPCVTANLPKPSITWKLNNRVIVQNAKYSFEDGTLIIRDPTVSDTGSYTCEAVNKLGTVSATFETNIRQKPKLSGDIAKKVIIGSPGSIECKVDKGNPKPTITWQFMDESNSKFVAIAGSDKVLLISRVENKHAGRYKCVANNSVGSDEHITTLEVQEPPQVSGVAVNKVKMGAPTRIECTVVKGQPKPTITWQFMDGSSANFVAIAGSDNVLQISRVENKHAGRYKCVAINSVGSDEHVTTLEVQEPPKIDLNVSTTYQSTEGDAVLKIPCAAAGLPKPTITWKLDGRVINPSEKYSIDDGTLIIKDPKVSDAKSYTCEAKNDVGVVSTTFKANIHQIPHVSGDSAKQVKIGTAASIECKVDKGEPKPTITWQFIDNSSSKNLTTVGSESVLHISKVEHKHAGRYKCVAQNSVGSDEHVTTLEVQEPPKIDLNVSTTYQSTEGDALLKIPCAAAGLPKPTITWKVDGRVINPSVKYSIDDGTLIIRDPKVSDAKSYTCEAKNDVGVVSTTFKANIHQIPHVSGDSAKQVTIGTAASIECKVDKGEPKPTITWQFMDNSNSMRKSAKSFTTVGFGSVLHISSVEHKHAGRYKCVAKNSVGSDEHITTLEVQEPPQVSGVVANKVRMGSPARIECTVVKGKPKPTFTWQFMDNSNTKFVAIAGSDKVLHISTVENKHAGRYKCVANNSVGSDEHITTLEVQEPPQVSGVTVNKVKMGSPARIECTIVKGQPKPTITWQFMDVSSAKFVAIDGSDKVLLISRVENKHAGRYKCVAINSLGSDEHVTTLEVQVPPTIVSSVPVIYQSTEGNDFLRVPCAAAGQPKPSITWMLDGRVINPSAKYSIEDETGTLIIRAPKVGDTISYTCEAKNEAGVVRATIQTYIRQAPQLSGVPIEKVRKGSPATIECTVKGEPKPTIKWQFKANSNSKFLPIPGSDKALHISRVENEHAGFYKCVANNSLGTDEHITTLEVQGLPKITINTTTIEGVLGDLAMRIPCNVGGVPKPDITWKKNGATITPDEKYSIEDGALIIAKPAKGDSTSYTCEAKNSIGSVSATFQAAVRHHPKSFGTEHYVYLKQGETKKLECEAYTSGSQSVKWFETKEDSSLSTTSSPQTENTTPSSSDKGSSMTSRTFVARNKTPYYEIANASFSDHDGNYTCHVSDKHGNTQTHTYVVDVGVAPKFVSEDNSLSNWRGDISDITQYCDIQPNAKPTPKVQWSFNGKVLTDLNSVGLGYYTCNVSNVHGSLLKQFDVKSSVCLITRNLKDAPYMPLVLNDEGFWHKLKTTDYYTIVEEEEKITLVCPSQKETSNTFKKFPKLSSLEATCFKEDYFIVGRKTYKFSQLECTNNIEPSVIKKKVKCSTETSELISVGYNVPAFLEAYEVCFDHKINMPIYTRIIMTESNKNGPSTGYNWYTYPGIGNAKTERGFTCKDASSSCCYSKSQLVNAIDFNDGPAKKSTFIDPLNVIPVWLPCNTSKPSWKAINNDMVRTQLDSYSDIVVWSGTHTLEEKNGAAIPRYLWKVVRLDDDEAMAIVYVNDPNPTASDIKCSSPDVCDAYEDWIVSDNSIYCCSLPDFLKSFDFHDTDIGESLDAALDKMKNLPDSITS